MKYRLIDATISGVKCIDKPFRIDFINQYPTKKDLSQAHIKSIYGPNGSGKTAIIIAFDLYKNLIINIDFLSNSSTPFDGLINGKTKKFEVTVTFMKVSNKKMYRHHIVADFSKVPYRVTEEELYLLGRRKEEECILGFKDGVISTLADYKDYASSISGRLTGSLSSSIIFGPSEKLNVVANTKMKPYIDLLLFALSLDVFYGEKSDSPSYLSTYSKLDAESLEKISYRENNYFADKMKGYDDVILEIEKEDYEIKVESLTEFVKLMKPSLEKIDKSYRPLENGLMGIYLKMVYDNGNLSVPLTFESTGVRKIVRLFDSILAANKGSIVFIDEIDADIHDVFLCNLLDYFARYTDVQLVITTHNVDIMNNVKSLKHSIDFISQDNVYTAWIKNGTKSPKNAYLKGMVSHIPFNLLSSDFISIFSGENDD